MKKIKLFMLILLSMTLSACSFLDEVNNSISYVSTATEHINELNTFAESAPQMIEDALTNPEVLKELETQLTTLKVEIEEFVALENIPTIAQSIHQELVSKNEVLLNEINKVMENGNLVIEQLENSQVFTTINEVTKLLNQIENLSQ
jgi:ribosomal protein L16 Arg81 hydroxylase